MLPVVRMFYFFTLFFCRVQLTCILTMRGGTVNVCVWRTENNEKEHLYSVLRVCPVISLKRHKKEKICTKTFYILPCIQLTLSWDSSVSVVTGYGLMGTGGGLFLRE